MPRSFWKGEISFGLVSIPVSLYSTEEQDELKFHLLDKKTKSRVHYQRVSEKTGKEVPWDQIVKGFEFEKDRYIVVDEKKFEKASPDLFKAINIEEFVDFQEIDSLYLIKPYYLIPESKNKKAYVLLRESLKKTNKAGVAKVIIRTKESICLILPHQHALLLYLIHFKDEIREEKEMDVPQEEFKTYKISQSEIKMAVTLIDEMTTKWEPEKYHNEYRETLKKWLDQQIAKQPVIKEEEASEIAEESSADVVDFIALLKESMKKKKTTEKTNKKKSS
ncbi:Ku protein [Legionella steigerwaltii]|uniref:Non-homologous end joining protein Ku n=1 Tax=Legionella steigerwaltii TaxID=460 RepID=A0A378L7F9_9GAMM|nr:Ku protein [Legionella steigerwaltii]KTD77410.1 putative DNA repair protein YkoV [Legionella steigerwaltii]STY22290.1 Ku protein [Legionella steigerwaltii]